MTESISTLVKAITPKNAVAGSDIKESTTAFLDLAFRLKKPVENKTHKEWEEKFRKPECDETRCPNP